MIKIANVHLKHNGILADNSTKLTMYLPECTSDQHVEIIKMAQMKTVSMILIDPAEFDLISELLLATQEAQKAGVVVEDIELEEPDLVGDLTGYDDAQF